MFFRWLENNWRIFGLDSEMTYTYTKLFQSQMVGGVSTEVFSWYHLTAAIKPFTISFLTHASLMHSRSLSWHSIASGAMVLHSLCFAVTDRFCASILQVNVLVTVSSLATAWLRRHVPASQASRHVRTQSRDCELSMKSGVPDKIMFTIACNCVMCYDMSIVSETDKTTLTMR